MPSIQSLITPNVRTWVTGETYTPNKQNQDDRFLNRGIIDLNAVIADVEKHFADSTAPNAKPQGKVWYDTGNSVLSLYQTALATPAKMLDSQTAYQQSIATNGTGTIKPMGAIDVNTTPITSSAAANEALRSYTLPANTLNSNNSYIDALGFFTDAAGTAAAPDFGWGTIMDSDINFSTNGASVSDFFAKIFAVRIGASSIKLFGIMRTNIDAVGAGQLVVSNATANDSLTGNLAIGFNNGAGGAKSQQSMLTKLIY